MAGLVVDCSAFLPLCFEDEASEISEAMLERVVKAGAMVPAIWWYEIRNVLVVNERRGRIEASQSEEFLSLLGRLPLSIVMEEQPGLVLRFARAYSLSAYDAAYLALAREHALPLATLDQRLADAAARAEVAVFGS